MFQFGGFNVMFPEAGRNFKASYKCFSVSMLPGNERQDVENGGKIIMPPSALDSLTRLNVEYPMLFKLINNKKGRTSHAGVLEFVADEGKCYLPYWMMDNLLLEEGDILTIESVSLPVAKFSKFQPHSTDFLDITNPKAVLENALRNFACLTTGDVVAIKYNKKVYELCVLETKPGNAVSIIECDMNVEFEAPVGYKEPTTAKKEQPVEEQPQDHVMEEVVETFKGSGVRLDGKKKKDSQLDTPVIKKILARGVPDYDYKFGMLKFDRTIKPISDRVAEIESAPEPEETFQGQGFSMKKSRK
ncbi:putative ubiquitin fusion degradation protein 1 [Lucilia cuprina]|uniref:Ubiquitin fusion degradation protein 1 homolog n=1 Tax=Lucilia cuprina TaxID=7375 RepID=A0A0L0C0H7_LUCCU|nr:ubiquitin fusion degradation protein 1 homolog [Lucilia cuprina]KAI8126543.1 Ubiquitin fusion degradation protein 1 like protein [Lucilia cuprina]KAI8126544.1 Ubiquitin fusion degradation protein 1 like protein [Lucilia cuprina]KNC25761.1 putative ubiquitin fusion degradation protein 1 [Lucilia cuprina]